MTPEETIVAQAQEIRALRSENTRRFVTILALSVLLALRIVAGWL